MIVYLHGFNSSPMSGKCSEFAVYCGARNIPLIAPQLPHRPAKAAAAIEAIVGDGEAHTLIGSSLGGFYATAFCEKYQRVRAVLINPAVRVAAKLAPLAGQIQRNYYSGASYRFTEKHAAELRALEVAAPKRAADYLLLLQTGDEVLDWREAAAFYHGATMVVEEGGDHSFADFPRHYQRILKFAAGGDDKKQEGKKEKK
jgi:predicted esterase YcpF (UPF0227 family)